MYCTFKCTLPVPTDGGSSFVFQPTKGKYTGINPDEGETLTLTERESHYNALLIWSDLFEGIECHSRRLPLPYYICYTFSSADDFHNNICSSVVSAFFYMFIFHLAFQAFIQFCGRYTYIEYLNNEIGFSLIQFLQRIQTRRLAEWLVSL